ncbi:MAG: hypothetical protein ACRDUV_19535, partial [Pseudonocardiaceae bacterium]
MTPHAAGDDLATVLLTWIALPAFALLTVVGALTWVAAQLTSVLTGAGWRDIEITEAPALALAVLQHPDHPESVIHSGEAASGPGSAWLFWALFALLVAAAAAVVLLGLRRWLPAHSQGRTQAGAHSGARWATRVAEAPMSVPTDPAQRPGRLVAGHSLHAGRRLLAGQDCISAVGFGPNGSGKTTGLIAPNVAEWDGPVMMTTTKIADLALIHAHRGARGPVWVVAPGGAPGYATAGWSPVAYACDAEAADRMAEWLVEASGLASDPKSRPWLIQARKYVKPLLLAAHLSGRGIGAFTNWVYAGRDASD